MKQRHSLPAAAPAEMPPLDLPVKGGERTLDQVDALARALAGQRVDPADLAPCDRPAPVPTAAKEEI